MTQRPPSSRPGHDRAAAENRRKNRSKSGILLFHPRICLQIHPVEGESQQLVTGTGTETESSHIRQHQQKIDRCFTPGSAGGT